MQQIVRIRPGGSAIAVYQDDLSETLQKAGFEQRVTRASHVEPGPYGGWVVDFSPIGGPVYDCDESGQPFRRRDAAEAFERRVLDAILSGKRPDWRAIE